MQASHAKRGRKFCSDACMRLAQDKKPTFACEACGKVTVRTKNALSQAYNYKQRFCCRACADDAQRTGSTDKNGYRVFVINGVQNFEHRMVMEAHLGQIVQPRNRTSPQR